MMMDMPDMPMPKYSGPAIQEEDPGFSNDNLQFIPPADPGYDNIDYAKLEAWLVENVYSKKGWREEPTTGEIFDEKGNVVGHVPTFYKTN
jgi:hypothetical protein